MRCRGRRAFVTTKLDPKKRQGGVGLNAVGRPQAPAEQVEVLRSWGQTDVFSPMVYRRMCGREPAWIGEVT
jgi:hypothetical protein